MSAGLKTRSIKGLLWSVSEGAGVAVLSLGTFVVLARLLEPSDFGVVALGSAFIICFNLVVAHSFVDSVVLQPHLTPRHLDTAFWSTLAAAGLLALACYAGADLAARRLGEPKLASVLPWLSAILVINALGAVPIAIFRRDLRFRAIALCTLFGRLAGTATSIGMAFAGFGLWSLVAQQVVPSLVTSAAVVIAAGWRPGLRFSLPYLREMGGFGFHVSTAQVVSGVGEQSMNLLIGSLFGSVALGHFSVAWRMVQLIRSLIASAVYQVAFSAFAKLQHDRQAMTRAFMQATRMSCLIGFPIGAGMAVTAEPAILVMFGDKWQASIPLYAILALGMIPAFFTMFFSAGYRAMGRPSWALYMSLLYFVVGLGGMLALARFGIVAVTAFWVVKSVGLLPIHVLLMRRLLGIRARDLAAAAAAPAAAAAVTVAAVAALLWVLPDELRALARLGAAIALGLATYLACALLLAPGLVRGVLDAGRIMITPLSSQKMAANDAGRFEEPPDLAKTKP